MTFTRICAFLVLVLGFTLTQVQAQVPYGVGTLNRRRPFTAVVNVRGQDGVTTAAQVITLPTYSKMVAICPNGDTGTVSPSAILFDSANVSDTAGATTTCNKAIPIRSNVLRGIDGEGNKIMLSAPNAPNTLNVSVNVEAYY